MKLRKEDIVELWIDGMAFGGQGVARLDGLVIFVRGALPGDRILARIIKKKKDYAEAVLVGLIESSMDRVQPPCPYSGYCGGCQWQHIRYERQLEYKREHIYEIMARLGAIPDLLVRDAIPSKNIYGYRNKMEFSFSDRPWLLPNALKKEETISDLALGLHASGSFHKVIDTDSCLLQNETGNKILREVKRYVRNSSVPVYGLKSHRGFWRFLMLRHSKAFNEWMVNLITSEEKRDLVGPFAETLCATISNIKTVVNNINTRRAAVAIGEREVILIGDGYIADKIGPFHFRISANSFFQTNTTGAEILYQTVVKYTELTGSEIVLDLYSGTGIIPIFLSGGAKEVIGIEIVESAVQDARNNCWSNQIHNCRFILGDIRKVLCTVSQKPDIVVIDPPRTGLHEDVLMDVLKLAPERIVYVSCNPATMARDLGRMFTKYNIIEIQPVDMFPHTFHIEAVAKMVRRSI